MQEENNTKTEPETAEDDMAGNMQTEADKTAEETDQFIEETLIADHADYEMDWSEYDRTDTDEKPVEDGGSIIKDSGYYDREIRKLKRKREQHENHYARMRNKLKRELRKDRNARLVMWGAEFEYQVGQRNPSLKKLLPYLDRDTQKKIVWRIFAEISISTQIISILKNYTKDVDATLPDDLASYAEQSIP